MFPIPSVLVAVAAFGPFLASAAPVPVDNSIKIDNPLGFHTAGSAEFFRAYWGSVKDRSKMTGLVSDHLTREQIESIIVLEVNIAIAAGHPTLQDELLAFMTAGNRFETGRLPDRFDKERPRKYVTALFRTRKGEYGLITRYREIAVVEWKGMVGVAPVVAGGTSKPAAISPGK